MFGTSKIRAQLEEIVRELRELTRMSWRLEGLERENTSLRTWNEKVRATNSALRRDRRRMRQLLEANSIPWERETPEG